ncbi:MAG: hypothetical protein IJB86_03080 [Clostridia bacterium]|nr:hypothetical protein [Clostridia bacterium]
MAHAEDGRKDVRFICSDEKKNIFLIGDSIRMGFCDVTREALSDEAEVFYVDDNCRNTQYVIINLFSWANLFDAPEKVDIVQFNCGHWDLAHWCEYVLPLTSETEYTRNLIMIAEMTAKLFPNAKIVFATTTPMNPNGQLNQNVRTTADIARYNDAAKKALENRNIAINDLFEITKDWDASFYADYCHFTQESNKILGNSVASELKKYF